MKSEIIEQKDSQVNIKVTFEPAELETYREDITNKAIENVEIDGFRKGKVPRDMALEKINPLLIFQDMAYRALSEKYISILQEHDIKAIGNPEIKLTKLAEGNPVEFELKTYVLPEITVGDYKVIAKKTNNEKESVDLDDKELDEAIMNIRKMRFQQEDQTKASEDAEPVSWNDIKEEDLPDMTDDWVKGLGAFENLEDFRTKMKENLLSEKQAKAADAQRIKIIDGIIEGSTFEIPQPMVEYELDKMVREFEHNITMSGMKFDDYLSSISKTVEDYRTLWNDQAIKRVQTELILNHIAEKESLQADEKAIEAEVGKLLEQYGNQKGLDEASVRNYVTNVLTHQKVFEFLDAQS